MSDINDKFSQATGKMSGDSEVKLSEFEDLLEDVKALRDYCQKVVNETNRRYRESSDGVPDVIMSRLSQRESDYGEVVKNLNGILKKHDKE